jgi:nucleoside-diphosphate-sugar epimerase
VAQSIRAECGPAVDMVLTEALEPKPTDAYGKSKLAAELGLAQLDIGNPRNVTISMNWALATAGSGA